nr:hypothetical protein [Escherichia coli]
MYFEPEDNRLFRDFTNPNRSAVLKLTLYAPGAFYPAAYFFPHAFNT